MNLKPQTIFVYCSKDTELSKEELDREVSVLVKYMIDSYLRGTPQSINFRQPGKKPFELCAIAGNNFNPIGVSSANKLEVHVIFY